MNRPAESFLTLLDRCAELGGSDLHLSEGGQPYIRIDNTIGPLEVPRLAAGQIQEIIDNVLTERQRQVFRDRMTLDFAIQSRTGRFRANLFWERGRHAMAIRRIDDQFRSFEELSLPRQFADIAEFDHGLVVVTGATGSGKSTSLATLIHRINQTRDWHIITVEDPVEYVHANVRCLIRQRELHTDVPTFAAAVRDSLREDPDVILVGEMRDVETMRAAVTAAETGHLVFSTLHTGDAIGAIDRMISVFPAAEQTCLREQLSRVLRAVVSQRLMLRKERQGRVPVMEILRVNNAVANQIRKGEQHQIHSVMQTGNLDGMLILEQSLADLVAADLIDVEEAFRMARDEDVLESRLRMVGQLVACR